MTSVFEIDSWQTLAPFFVWTLAVCAAAKALFGSFIAAEVQYRVAMRSGPKRQRIARLTWEVAHRAAWVGPAIDGTPQTADLPGGLRLDDEDVERRRRELRELARQTLVGRAATYFMACFACQTFWAAAVIYGVTRGAGDPLGWLLSAAAYSAGAVLLARLGGAASASAIAGSGGRPRCRSCGR